MNETDMIDLKFGVVRKENGFILSQSNMESGGGIGILQVYYKYIYNTYKVSSEALIY